MLAQAVQAQADIDMLWRGAALQAHGVGQAADDVQDTLGHVEGIVVAVGGEEQCRGNQTLHNVQCLIAAQQRSNVGDGCHVLRLEAGERAIGGTLFCGLLQAGLLAAQAGWHNVQRGHARWQRDMRNGRFPA